MHHPLEVFGVALDSFGNVNMTGSFRNSVDFDPGTGEEWISPNGQIDNFLLKLDSDGFFIWVRTWGGNLEDFIYDVAVDLQDNTLVTGWYQASVDLDPGPGEDIHYQMGEGDVFVSSFDPDGSFRWGSAWGGRRVDQGRAVSFDSEGNGYIAGVFWDDVDFDPGEGIDRRFADCVWDMFVCKYDSLGNYVWTLTWDGCNGNPDLVVDSDDLLHIVGTFGGVFDFDTGPGVEERNSEIDGENFIGCYDSEMNFQWVQAWGGPSTGSMDQNLVLDGIGNHLITGTFLYPIDFDPGPGEEIREALGNYDSFLCKFDPLCNLVWVDTWGSPSFDEANKVGVDALGNGYVVGGFRETVDFNPGPGIENRDSVGYQDAYLLKILADGTW